jgi:epoxyqueuosine reductase QueG
MKAEAIKKWIKEEIRKRGYNGIGGIARFSDVYKSLMPLQRKEVQKSCRNKIKELLKEGSAISIAVFHTEKAINSINTRRNGEINYEKWNIYAEEYHSLNKALNEICDKLAPMLNGIAFKATVEGNQITSVEEYYPMAKISHRVVAEHAGIGARGKCELIVTKQNGAAVRLATVITPRKLKPDKKIGDLCGDCTACLDQCKILQQKEKLQNYRQQCMTRIKALNLHYEVCGICIKACYTSGNWRNFQT